jgi:D-lactate dehydrogenase
VDGVVDLARRVQADKELSALIRRKFAIKCTTGTCMLTSGHVSTSNWELRL